MINLKKKQKLNQFLGKANAGHFLYSSLLLIVESFLVKADWNLKKKTLSVLKYVSNTTRLWTYSTMIIYVSIKKNVFISNF